MEEFRDWPDLESFKRLCASFKPFISRQVSQENNFTLSRLKSLAGDMEVEVACCSQGEEFSGIESKSQSVNMRLETYLEGFEAHQNNEQHWITAVKDLNLYLSQLTVMSEKTAASQDLLSSCELPKVLQQSELYEVNVWANVAAVSSSLHYDGNHNLLHVQIGTKEVLLVSPLHTNILMPCPLQSSTPNHSALSHDDVKTLLRQRNAFKEETAFNIALNAGDCLFIPEGWWHQVRSDAVTYAVNFWFRSSFNEICSLAFLAPYVTRTSLRNMLQEQLNSVDEKDAQCSSIMEKSSKQFILETLPPEPTFSIADFAYPCDFFSNLSNANEDYLQLQIDCLTDLCQKFSSSDLQCMKMYWTKFAAKNRNLWSKLVLNLTPEQCFILTRKWENVDCSEIGTSGAETELQTSALHSVQEMCQIFLEAKCEEECWTLKNHIISSRNQFAKRILEDKVLPVILGADDVGGMIVTGVKRSNSPTKTGSDLHPNCNISNAMKKSKVY